MAKPSRNLGLWIGLGAASLAGYGIARLIAGKRKQQDAPKPVAAEPDRPLEMVQCPGCGKTIKEYEFFCPYCGKTRDKE